MKVKALWCNVVLAESDATKVIDGTRYFPPDSVNWHYFRPSVTRTRCPRKGEAHYFDVVVNGDVNADAAWHFPRPQDGLADMAHFVGFWRGVSIIE